MYFYFEQVFRNAVNGINATAVPTTMVQIAGAILIAALVVQRIRGIRARRGRTNARGRCGQVSDLWTDPVELQPNLPWGQHDVQPGGGVHIDSWAGG